MLQPPRSRSHPGLPCIPRLAAAPHQRDGAASSSAVARSRRWATVRPQHPLGYPCAASAMRGHGGRSVAALNAGGHARHSSQPLVRHGNLPEAFRIGFLWPFLFTPVPLVPRLRRFCAQRDLVGADCMRYPATPFRHLQRLTDNIGLLRHADGVVPLHEHGYYVDDVACGLLVVCREPSPSQEVVVLGRRYLYFLAQAQALGGKFRNHLGYDRRWHDQPGTEDGWGHSLWALGTAAARGPTTGIREESFTRFCRGARVSSLSPHAMAFAALGAAEILDKQPGHPAALALLHRASVVIGNPPADAAWPWPAPRLGNANAAIAEAIVVSGCRLGDARMLRNGLRMLKWLLATETRDGHLSLVSPQGWSPGERRPASDQRPAEVAALADACMRAATVTGDHKWLTGVEMSVAWFLGDNDAKVPLLDERTGGCSDGLTSTGRCRNQGAESTLAMISVLQQGHRMASARQ